jgi:small subunit ribosomal protein S17
VSEQQDVSVVTIDEQAADIASTADTAQAEQPTKKRGDRKTREGMVVSDKMTKTIVVELEDRVKHPRYSKVIRRTTKVKAHDENGTAGVGDRVLLAETRPLSATKRWRLVQVIERAQ